MLLAHDIGRAMGVIQVSRSIEAIGETRFGDRLNLGAGTTIIPGWTNLDGSWNARLGKHPRLRQLLGAVGLIPRSVAATRWPGKLVHHDVRRPLRFESASVGAVYSSHMLEHLYRVDAERLLAEIFRVLVPGGVVRLVVPDLRAIVERYVARSTAAARVGGEPAAELLNEELLLRERAPRSGSVVYRLYSALLDFHSHKWMYDGESLAALVAQAGFVQVGERGLFDSRIPDIGQIEQESRVAHGAGVCVEGIKPEA